MIFQQLSLSYHTSVSGDHHVTTWADKSMNIATTYTTWPVTFVTKYPPYPLLWILFFNFAYKPYFVTLP